MKPIIFFIAILITSCNSLNQKQTPTVARTQETKSKRAQTKITITPSKQAPVIIGDRICFDAGTNLATKPDSIRLSIESKLYKTFKKNDSLVWNTNNEIPGKKKLHFAFFWADSLSTTSTISTELLSDITPLKYSYTIKNKWPHNINAYTQGLEFSDGYLYEGTGLTNKSMLFKLNLEKNEIIQSINLPNEVFGEGITILGDKIYQITWRSNTGFVYHKESLSKLYSFTYPTEGWGLTNNGVELIMSDGSNLIYFLDTEFLQETKRVQVYDNNGPIKNLNELEFVDGQIYANIYGTDEIVAFEAETGKVTIRINMQGLLSKVKVTNTIDVLNGIAYDKTNKRFIVTGKFWPYYFEVAWVK